MHFTSAGSWAFAGLAICAATTSVHAQSTGNGSEGPSGLTIGAEAGLLEHHIYLAEVGPGGERSNGGYHRSWGAGAGLFVGYDVPLSRRVFIGAEMAGVVGGRDIEANFSDGASYRASPRYGWRLKGRLGYNLTSDFSGYATVGYGGHTYRVDVRAIEGAETSGSSFVVGGGMVYRLNRRVVIRLDASHLDNQSNQVFIGLPFRF